MWLLSPDETWTYGNVHARPVDYLLSEYTSAYYLLLMTLDKCDALKSFLRDLDDLGVEIKTEMFNME